MGFQPNPRVVLLLCLLVPLAAAPQKMRRGDDAAEAPKSAPQIKKSLHKKLVPAPLLNSNEGLTVLGAALETRGRPHAKPDCSHLVHTIYEHAGFPYSYVSSSDLYRGVNEFRHILHPQPGDLVAWPGHVGIVVNPVETTFYSSLRTGIGVESYSAPYWKERGTPRFYRYLKPPPIQIAKSKTKPKPATSTLTSASLRASSHPKQTTAKWNDPDE